MGLDGSSLRKEEVSVPHYSHQWECTRAKGYAVHLFYQSVIFCYDTHEFLNLSSSVQKFHLLQQQQQNLSPKSFWGQLWILNCAKVASLADIRISSPLCYM